MKRAILVTAVLALILCPIIGRAELDTQSKTANQILLELKQEQKVSDVGKIDPDRVGESRLEELGEAVMDLMMPDAKQHQWMDDMMGGQNSQSLKSMHRMMGYNYLGGGRSTGGFWNMMGGRGYFTGTGMMNGYGHGMMGGSSRDGSYGFYNWLFGIFMLLLFLFVLGLVIFFTIRLVSKTSGTTANSPLEILKTRYAAGELSKDEYDKMKKELM